MKNNIKKFREEQGINQNSLAEITGLSSGYLCHLERGNRINPSYNTMCKIANALNKTVSEIFVENEE